MTHTTATTKSYCDKWRTEQSAAAELRIELSAVIGHCEAKNPEIADMIQKALDKHSEEKEQSWS
jgi:hypothetical protein